jgi:hypothetical protein
MLNRVSNLEETTLTNVGIDVGFICSLSFHKWSHSFVAWVFVWTIAQHTKEQFTFSHTFTHIKQKQLKTRTIKIKNPKNNIEKIRRKEKRKQRRK